MSDFASDVTEELGLPSREVNFIAKPFSKANLAQKIRDVLDEYENNAASLESKA